MSALTSPYAQGTHAVPGKDCVRVSRKDKLPQSTLLFNFINVVLFCKNRMHVHWLTANLRLNKAARRLNTVTEKSNLHMRNSFNLQTTN